MKKLLSKEEREQIRNITKYQPIDLEEQVSSESDFCPPMIVPKTSSRDSQVKPVSTGISSVTRLKLEESFVTSKRSATRLKFEESFGTSKRSATRLKFEESFGTSTSRGNGG